MSRLERIFKVTPIDSTAEVLIRLEASLSKDAAGTMPKKLMTSRPASDAATKCDAAIPCRTRIINMETMLSCATIGLNIEVHKYYGGAVPPYRFWP